MSLSRFRAPPEIKRVIRIPFSTRIPFLDCMWVSTRCASCFIAVWVTANLLNVLDEEISEDPMMRIAAAFGE